MSAAQPASSPPQRAAVRPLDRPSTALALLLLTVLSTLYAGSINAGLPGDLWAGAPFSAALLVILGAHELGHFFTARRNGVRSTLPLFIPGPPLAGTFGALIRMRSVVRNRGLLLRIGAAGPLAGAAVAVPLLAIGLALSSVEPAANATFTLGDSILIKLLTYLLLGPLPDQATVLIHPVAFAGWIGLFVTNLNLFPAGQLDGGHVVFGVLGRRHALISRLTFVSLAVWGVFGDPQFASLPHVALGVLVVACAFAMALAPATGPSRRKATRRLYLIAALAFVLAGIISETFSATNNWVMWSAVVALIRLDHPPTSDLLRPPEPRSKLLAAACLLLFVLTFIPAPFSV